jgi:hypothetical protein
MEQPIAMAKATSASSTLAGRRCSRMRVTGSL